MNKLHITQYVSNFMTLSAEVCHPRSAFKLHGKVNFVKNTTINYG